MYSHLTRSLFIGLFVCLLFIPAFATIKQRDADADDFQTKLTYREFWRTPEILAGRFSTDATLDLEQAALEFFATRANQFRLADPEAELAYMQQSTDVEGKTHLRFKQVYHGLPVWGCETIVHFDDQQRIYLVAGQTIPTPQIDDVPGISRFQAEQIAKGAVKTLIPEAATSTNAELVVFPWNKSVTLCWNVAVTLNELLPVRWRVFVNAHSGAVELALNDVPSDGPAVGTGLDTRDSVRTLQTYALGGVFRLTDASRPMFTPPLGGMQGIIATWYTEMGTLFDCVSDPDGDNYFDDNDSLKAAVAGHYYAGLAYEYFRSTFGRDSWDDAGGSLWLVVHDTTEVNNAFSLGEGLTVYGSGDGVNWLPWSGSLDIVAHEITHNITENTAQLIYAYQSGALNESFSDFFGAMVDRDDWLIGEEIALWPDGRLRSMSDPANGLDPDRYSFGYQPAHMDDYYFTDISFDNGAVHINSGIPNHVGYLVAQDIGREKTEQIWYRTLTTYLTPNSHFYFWGEMTIQSAEDLYGSSSPEVDAVKSALEAVGIGLLYVDPPVVAEFPVTIGNFSDTTVDVVNGDAADTLDILSATTTSGLLTVTSSFPITLNGKERGTISLSVDATGLGLCDIGSTFDTVVIATTSTKTPTLRVPVRINVGLSAAKKREVHVGNCFTLLARNTADLSNGFFGDVTGLYGASPMVGFIDGTDTIVYHSYGGEEAEHPFTPVDYFSRYMSPGGYQVKEVALAGNDARIHGEMRFYIDNFAIKECRYTIGEYMFFNPCDTPLTVLTGMICDFDVLDGQDNICDYDAPHNLIYCQDHGQWAMGIALIGEQARNLRAINNPDIVWPNSTLLSGDAYREMSETTNQNGVSEWDDWSAILTFGEETISANDSVTHQVAFIFSDEGVSGLFDILAEIVPASDSRDMALSPARIRTYLAESATTNPPDSQIMTQYFGSSPVSWQATHTAFWSSIYPGSGLTGEAITYSYDALMLAPGTYRDTVRVHSPDLTDFDRETIVTLTVIPGDGKIRVPEEYGDIQSAIDAAQSGEQILVGNGTYSESIDFSGKDVQVISSYGPAVTVLQTSESELPLVNFTGGESSFARLSGFRLTKSGSGPAVLVGNLSSPTIDNNIFTGLDFDVNGAAIKVDSAFAVIANNLFYDNPGMQTAISVWLSSRADIVGNSVIGIPGESANTFYVAGEAYYQFVTFELNVVTGFTYGVDVNDMTSLNCNNVWGNTYNYYTWVSLGIEETDPGGTNISADPAFCNPPEQNYTLCDISPCAEANSPCGKRIGARGVACSLVCGDANNDGSQNISDAVHIINWVFKGGEIPVLLQAADADCNGQNNISDAVRIVNWIFKGGPAPCCP